ncbi:HPP family protein [Novosphingobium sp. 9U]|uniref:HPP family protein n=1 Tax=Novosphingobium sp. 9U TaxID=2653158 RepID=UPI0012EF46F9|nr:HPP family protein [Novosphingobium sp. 9U]VWX54359.1 conserved membrane hypothetical protein [Novosphingobium sp. 9U]
MPILLRRTFAAPPRAAFGHLGWLRGALGGVFGIAAAGTFGTLILGAGNPALPWLVAPAGASAVLVFAVPASPLAQPWAVIGGNVVSAMAGLVAGHLLGVPLLGASIGVGLAIGAMSLLRCLHPPGGACALLYALGATGPEHWGAAHLLTIVINVLALGAAGWLYNNLTGHSWPHRPVHIPVVIPGSRSAQVHQALTEVLAEWNEVIDADIDDLDAIFQAVERRIRSAEQDVPPAAVI